MEEQFLDETGLQKVAENVNSRLKTVTIMPVNPKDGQIVLYVGESGMAYTKGCTYQFDESEDEWMDITPELIADQNYNPQSENAQSGIALSQAQTVLFNKLFSRNNWGNKTWNNYTPGDGYRIWTDGDNIYFSMSSYQYVLNKTTSTWETKTWYGMGGEPSFDGYNVWTDGDNIYVKSYDNFVLNKATSTWEPKEWYGVTDFSPEFVWTDGDNIYYSKWNYHRVLNKSTSTWESKTWNGLTNFDGRNIWTDGVDIYHSSQTDQYVLNKATSTWEPKIWQNLSEFDGMRIWSDGTNIYYSHYTSYVLNKATSTWEEKTWDVEIETGQYIWSDGTNVYYSFDVNQYEFLLSLKTYID